MRRLAFLIFLVPSFARAQFSTQGATVDNLRPDEEDIEEPATLYKARLSLTSFFYAESESGDPAVANTTQSTPNGILATDFRARVEARHISNSRFDVLGDLRIRLNPAPAARSRGYLGGEEYDLREAYAQRTGDSFDVAVGRHIIRDVDASTVDGFKLVFRQSSHLEYGAFAGLFPDPYSRSIDDDYNVRQADGSEAFVDPLPLVGGGWVGYRYARAHGAVGGGVLSTRETDDMMQAVPVRAFLTANGYLRASPKLDVIHFAVVDVAGPAGFEPLNLQGQLHYRASQEVLLEAGVSRMSTYSVGLYIKDLLEQNPVAPPAGGIQNNTQIIRLGTNEARVGATYTFLGPRVSVFGNLMYREREGLVLPEGLNQAMFGFPADHMIDVSAGVRQRKSKLGGWDLGATAIYISGDQSASILANARGSHGYLQDRLQLEFDLGFHRYEDLCSEEMSRMEPTCTGTAQGNTFRIGAMGAFRRDRHWLFVGDYHFSRNSATAFKTSTGTIESFNPILGHSLFVRAQYNY